MTAYSKFGVALEVDVVLYEVYDSPCVQSPVRRL